MNNESICDVGPAGLDTGAGDGVGLAAIRADVQVGHECRCNRVATGAMLHEIPDSALLDLPGLALALGCCERTARRMLARRQLPPGIRLGGRNVWYAGRVRQYLEVRMEEAEKAALRERARLGAL
jgi:predicted DNA-binding transcriptional regulator AlpA